MSLNNYAIHTFHKIILSAFGIAVCGLPAMALDASHYAASSRLATGSWRKIKVSGEGIHSITNAQLRSWGFNPAKVHVYGYGGTPMPELLTKDLIDDLPLLPAIHTPSGILFYGTSTVMQTRDDDTPLAFSHTRSAYTDESYYYISDCELREGESDTPVLLPEVAVAGGNALTSYTAQIIHEQDLVPAATTGTFTLGEDFLSQKKRIFAFDLPDNVGTKANVRVRAAATISARSGVVAGTVDVTNNGQVKSPSIKLYASSDKTFMQLGTATYSADIKNDALSLGLTFSSSHNASMARLDYIEVEYQRRLTAKNSVIILSDTVSKPCTYKVADATANTQVWDVTRHWAPRQVVTSLSDAQLTFNATPGARYAIFNTDASHGSVTPAGVVSNQNIHSMTTPRMVIISPQEYLPAAERVADIHRSRDGWTVHVLTPERIYNEFSSGAKDPGAFRKMLKMWHDRSASLPEDERIGYCLIMSRPTYDNRMLTDKVRNCGYPRIPIWQSPTGLSDGHSFCADDYIGMLSDAADDATAFDIGLEQIQVAVGRMPVTSLKEAHAAVDKLENYIYSTDMGAWRNAAMVIADDKDSGEHLRQAEKVISTSLERGRADNMEIEKLYLDAYDLTFSGKGAAYPAAKKRMLDKWQEGLLYINFIGHGNPRGWTHEDLLNWGDISSLSNRRFPFMICATCEFTRYDDDERSGGEEMWINPNGGIIGGIMTSRTVYISNNGALNDCFSEYMLSLDKDGKPYRVGDVARLGKNRLMDKMMPSPRSEINKLSFFLLGDPAMQLPLASHDVRLESINDKSVEGVAIENAPQLPARSMPAISGSVRDAAGNVISDFDGILEFALFDAELPVTTKGNGSDKDKLDGVVKIDVYNDRQTCLYKGATEVKNGKWSTKFFMPSELNNNFSPAKLHFYAYTHDGREASGNSTSFYAYGYDKSAERDSIGPDIQLLALNNESFKNGDVIGGVPIVIAKFSDPSGINVSDVGIGHQLSINIDGKIWLQDVTAYYKGDPYDPAAGSISYPLTDIAPGKHTLTLIVWDNAGNSTKSTIDFSMSVNTPPSAIAVSTDCNPARENVTISLTTDRPNSTMTCLYEVFDLNGRRVWSDTKESRSSLESEVHTRWNLTDSSGNRIDRGIYIYRVTVTTPDGMSAAKSGKIAVAAP